MSVKFIKTSALLDDEEFSETEEIEEEDTNEQQEDFTIEELEFTDEQREELYKDYIENTRGRTKAKAPSINNTTGKVTEQLQWNVDKATEITKYLKTVYRAKEIHHTYDFDKNVNMWAKVPSFKKPYYTGYCMYVSDTKLICIDFDIDKSLTYKQRIELRNKLVHKVIDIVRRPDMLLFDFSANGGFHVWLRNDIPQFIDLCAKDRSIQYYEHTADEHLAVDIIVPKFFDSGKGQFGVVLPFSIIDSAKGKSEKAIYRCYTMPQRVPEVPYNYSMFAKDIDSWIHLPQTAEEFTSTFALDAKVIKPTKAKEVRPKQAPKEKAVDDDMPTLKLDLETPVINTDNIKLTSTNDNSSTDNDDTNKDDEVIAKVDFGIDPQQPNIRTLAGYSQKMLLSMRPSKAIPRGFIPTKTLLYDQLIPGLDGVYVHGDCHNCAFAHLSVLHLASLVVGFIDGTYHAQASEQITADDLEDVWGMIYGIVTLSDNAEARWMSEFNRAVASYQTSTYYTHWTALVDYIWYYNPAYYDEYLKQIVDAWQPLKFSEDVFTYADFTKHINDYPKTQKQIVHELRRFIAKCDSNGYFIKTERDKNFNYEYLPYSKLSSEYKFKLLVKDNDGKVKQIPFYKFVTDAYVTRELSSYRCMKLFSNDPSVLATYRPPLVTDYNEKLILDWIEFIKSLLITPEPFIELLDSWSYRLNNANDAIAKFFVNFGPGNTGKTFLVSCFKRIAPFNSNVQVDNKTVEQDKHNAWLDGKALVWLEEAEAQNYQTKRLHQLIKQWSGEELAIRPLYGDLKVVDNRAIYGMNTNSTDLYGLINAEEAVIKRLVILQFKQTYPKDELDRLTSKFIHKTQFAWSLYYYLKNVHKRQQTYSPNRYFGKDRDEFIAKRRAAVPNSVVDWFLDIGSDLITINKAKSSNQRLAVLYEKAGNESYKLYANGRKNAKAGIRTTLTASPFHFTYTTVRCNGSFQHIFACPVEQYEKDLQDIQRSKTLIDANGYEVLSNEQPVYLEELNDAISEDKE